MRKLRKSEIEFVLSAAENLRNRLLTHAAEITLEMENFPRIFGQTLMSCTSFEVCQSPSNAAFSFDSKTGQMLINAAHISAIFDQVKVIRASARRPMSRASLRELRIAAVEAFLLHEWRHFAQGIAMFESVQAVKDTEGPEFLARLDLIADVDAARVLGWLEAFEAGERSAAAFRRGFHRTLRFICAACVPAFGVPIARLAKVRRALGLYFMLSRFELDELEFDLGRSPLKYVPFDVTLMPAFDTKWSTMSLTVVDPGIEVIVPRLQLEKGAIERLVEDINAGRFFDALARAQYIMALAIRAPEVGALPRRKRVRAAAKISRRRRLKPTRPGSPARG
jgi:hypothetical protein